MIDADRERIGLGRHVPIDGLRYRLALLFDRPVVRAPDPGKSEQGLQIPTASISGAWVQILFNLSTASIAVAPAPAAGPSQVPNCDWSWH